MRGARLAAMAGALCALALAVPAFARDCTDLVPRAQQQSAAKRAVTANDLVRLRDVGWPASVATEGPEAMAVSPDGDRVAFQVRRADPHSNSYCLGLIVAPVVAGGTLVLVDQGGELIRSTLDRTGITAFPTGVPQVIKPHWSPDGKWIAFLKRTNGITQVWRARADGTYSEGISTSDVDVVDLAWAVDGRRIIYASQPGLKAIGKNTETEGLAGFRYDGRFIPKASSRPFPLAPVTRAYFAIDLLEKVERAATGAERSVLEAKSGNATARNALLIAERDRAGSAWTYSRDPTNYIPTTALAAVLHNGRRTDCIMEICSHVFGLWWTRNGRDLIFMRHEGWGHSKTSVYQWSPGRGQPRRMFTTNDMLASCQPVEDELLCLHEASGRPREIARVDRHGNITSIVNLNPEFASIVLGPIERLEWRNAMGIETFGDLVLPPTSTHQRLPLVIVQYDSRGFLRGGTGDEYPIQLLAAKGFAVLSFERPQEIGLSMPSRNGNELEANNMRNWADLRSVLSSLERGVELLVTRGIVDRDRVGITGLSDGTRTAQFALLNSTLFAAASVSSAFEGPGTLIPLAGPAGAENYIASGYPRRGDEGRTFWDCYALASHAARLRSPILMQLSDDEYQGALETLAAFNDNSLPSALYVFPDEHHIKWQPAHRLAVYERNLAWFEYWLNRDHMDRDLVKGRLSQADLVKWDQLPPLEKIASPLAPVQCRAQLSASASASTRR